MVLSLALVGCHTRTWEVPSAPIVPPGDSTVVVVDPDPTTPPDADCLSRSIGPDGGTLDAGGAALLVAPHTFGEAVEVVALCRTHPPDDLEPLSDGWEVRVAPEAPFSAPMRISVAAEEAEGAAVAVFGPGVDGTQVRSLQATQTGPGWWTAPIYRPGVVTVALDDRVLTPFEGRETAADVLLLVDNSCSMLDEQDKLANRLPDHFLDLLEASDVAYRLAVVSTDNEDPSQMGNLIETAGERWVEPSTPDRDGVLADLVHVGNQGSLYEQGLATVSTALTEDDGFLRDGASLAVVAITHRDDYSEVSADVFAESLLGMSSSRPSVAFHSLVETAGNDRGTKYIAVSDAVGGNVGDLDGADWNRYFEEIARELASYGGMEVPAADLPEVWLTFPSGAEPVRLTVDQYVYDGAVLYALDPNLPDDATAWVLYLP